MQIWHPFRSFPLTSLRREMDRVLSGLRSDGLDWTWPGARHDEPAVNVWETADAVHLELEVPGVKSDQLDLSVVGSQLSIKIERPEVQEHGVTYHRRERPVGSFLRVVELPCDVEAEKVEASLEHGVLSITLPKAEAAKPRRIQVKAAT
jgi:HSP20 family protein